MAAARSQTLFPVRDLPTHAALEKLRERFPDLDPTAVECHLTLLRVATDVLATMGGKLQEAGVSGAKFSLLLHLLREDPTGLAPSVLADRMGVTRATVTGLLDGLERGGLVRRQADARDRRSVRVQLTAAGRRLLGRVAPGHLRRVSQVMGKLSAADRRQLVRLLHRIRDGLESLEAS